MIVSSIGSSAVTYNSVKYEESVARDNVKRQFEEKKAYTARVLKSEILGEIKVINRQLKSLNTNLELRYENNGKTFTLLVVNSKTDEILKIFSSSIAVSVLAQMKELLGVLIDVRV